MAMFAVHRGLLLAAGVCGFTGVLAGTFGAHALNGRISEKMLHTFEVGVRYHLIHAVALLALAVIAGAAPRARAAAMAALAGWLIVAGIIIFAGSLYLLALTEQRWLGRITPIGGACMLAGWLALVVAAMRMKIQVWRAS